MTTAGMDTAVGAEQRPIANVIKLRSVKIFGVVPHHSVMENVPRGTTKLGEAVPVMGVAVQLDQKRFANAIREELARVFRVK